MCGIPDYRQVERVQKGNVLDGRKTNAAKKMEYQPSPAGPALVRSRA
jgi:hypothetical protein